MSGADGTDVADDPEELRAVDGRVPGRRGRATRQKLLDQTLAMLEHTSFRELKVVDIAREAGTSPATFYQYFPDVEAAILALAEEMAIEGDERLTGMVRNRSWRGKAGYETALAIADAYISFWDDNFGLMRVIDLTSEEGDQRFRAIRTRLLNSFTVALSEVIVGERQAGRIPADVDPMATAGVLVSMLAHVSAHRYGFEFWGIRTDDIRTSMARIVYTTVTGQKVPTAG